MGPKITPLTTYLDAETIVRVDEVAKTLCASRSNAVRYLIGCALDGKLAGA